MAVKKVYSGCFRTFQSFIHILIYDERVESVVEKSACSEFKLDLCANPFNVCSECGRPKEEHTRESEQALEEESTRKRRAARSTRTKGLVKARSCLGSRLQVLSNLMTEEDWRQICAEVKDGQRELLRRRAKRRSEAGSSLERPLLSFLRCVMIDEAYSDLFPSGAIGADGMASSNTILSSPPVAARKVSTQVYRELIFDAGRVPQEKIFAFRSSSRRIAGMPRMTTMQRIVRCDKNVLSLL